MGSVKAKFRLFRPRAIPKVPHVWHLKDRKLIFYVRVKDELMKVEIMKESDNVFVCLIQIMICDK